MIQSKKSGAKTIVSYLIRVQVETIGDAYMVVAGAPEAVIDHAQKICSMALDMVDTIVHLKDSSTGA